MKNLKNNPNQSINCFASDPSDWFHMAMTIELAKKALYTTGPNPMVGCLIVLDGEVIAKGYHQKAGLAHAEQIALAKLKKKNIAKSDLKRASLYVSLEPCNHLGKTPACTDAIIESGIKRVVIATQDANPKMQGKSIKKLKSHQIDCLVGVLEKEAKAINLSHFKQFENNQSYVSLKIALNLEGQMDGDGSNRLMISSEKSQLNAHQLRAKVGAIITSSKTIQTDNPRLNVRRTKIIKNKYFSQPTRVILDRNLRLLDLKKINILNDLGSKVIIYHQKYSNLNSKQNQYKNKFKNEVELRVAPIDQSNGKFDLSFILDDLMAKDEINSVLFEAGKKLSSSVLDEKIADEIILYLANSPVKKTNQRIKMKCDKSLNKGNSILPQLEKTLVSYHLDQIEKISTDLKLVYRKNTP